MSLRSALEAVQAEREAREREIAHLDEIIARIESMIRADAPPVPPSAVAPAKPTPSRADRRTWTAEAKTAAVNLAERVGLCSSTLPECRLLGHEAIEWWTTDLYGIWGGLSEKQRKELRRGLNGSSPRGELVT